MASAKKDQEQVPESKTDSNLKKIDWSKYLPKDVDKSDLKKTGGLKPAYYPDEALTQGWDPIVVRLVGIKRLPEQRQGRRIWTPQLFHGVLRTPAKAMAGIRDDRKVVDLKPGDDILIPITGSLKIDSDLIEAARHPTRLYTACFAVVGQDTISVPDVDDPNPMFIWDARLVGSYEKREGRYEQMGITGAETASGTRYDPSTGEF